MFLENDQMIVIFNKVCHFPLIKCAITDLVLNHMHIFVDLYICLLAVGGQESIIVGC
jgi:hypothetical protein